MNEIPNNPILEFNPHQLQQVRKTYNYDDVNRLHQDIDLLRNWIQKQNHFSVKDYDKEYLERYLINCKGSVERAKKFLDKLCTIRGLMPDYFQGYDIRNEFKDMFKVYYSCVLPKPTANNNRVFFAAIYDSDAYEVFQLLHFNRYLMVILEYLSYHDYAAGLEIVIDLRKFTLNFIGKLNPVAISNMVMIMTEARGWRIKSVHLLSGSKLLDVTVAIVKQGLTKKLVSRLHVHMNIESLHDFLPKEILPKDYGGDEATLKEISVKNFKELSSDEHINKMRAMEKATTNESKRLSTEFNEAYSGMPGSFKILSVD